MELNQILSELNEIFIDILDNDHIVLNMSSNSKQIDEWDSLNNMQLVVAIEKRYKIKFTANEIQGWNSIGDMCESIQRKKQKHL